MQYARAQLLNGDVEGAMKLFKVCGVVGTRVGE